MWRLVSFFPFIFFPSFFLFAAYPHIERLHRSDTVFRQLENAIEKSYKNIESPLLFFTYSVRPEDTFESIAARLNGWQASLASLNQLDEPYVVDQQILLLPSRKGIFIYENSSSKLQNLLQVSRFQSQGQELQVLIRGDLVSVMFFDGKKSSQGDFFSDERLFFLDKNFQLPLRIYRVTSRFGWRRDPIVGVQSYHQGLDLAAPLGTAVYASKRGKVIEKSFNRVYGNYVIIDHGDAYHTLYGHLSRIDVDKGQSVGLDDIIGAVGTTGLTTGPHLHFEIRRDGQKIDPQGVLRKL